MLRRRLFTQLMGQLKQFPAVALLGPRQVGKTTLARQIAASRGADTVYLDLERPSDQRRLHDADAFLRAQQGKLVVIDEIHRAPGLFEVLRGIIDDRRAAGDRAGHFLLLGSAALDLLQQASETLAGRVHYEELAPIDVLELTPAAGDVDRLWIRGGFPDSLLADNDEHSMAWRRAFVRSYLERDVPMFAPRLPAETIRRLWTMLAHAQGTLLNQSRLASSLAVSSPAVSRYIDLLVDLLLVRRLRPWSGNTRKRLVKAPKTYIRDSGLTHALLDLTSWEDVLGHPVAGASWEGMVIENAIAVAGSRRTPYFYRTEAGAEVDLLFERGGKVEMAIEVKRSSSPELSKGHYSARAVLKPRVSYLVHGGQESWPIAKGIEAVTVTQLLARLADD